MQKARRHRYTQLRPLVSARFQGLFTPLLGVLFTFPLRYWFAIGFPVVFRLAGWCRQIQTGFLQPRLTQDTAQPHSAFEYGTLTLYGVPFQKLPLTSCNLMAVLQPQRARSPVWPLPRSLATTNGITTCFLFLCLLRCFSSAGSRLLSSRLQRERLPHSDTDGSKVVCTSPSLFAAYHVLRRLREPRHPPCALTPLPYLIAPYLRAQRHNNPPHSISQSAPSLFLVQKRWLSSFAFPISNLVNELFTPIIRVVENIGLEPMTPSLQS